MAIINFNDETIVNLDNVFSINKDSYPILGAPDQWLIVFWTVGDQQVRRPYDSEEERDKDFLKIIEYIK